jgi:hypothetical protein
MTRRAYHDEEQHTDAVVGFAGAGKPLDVVEDDSGVVWVHGEVETRLSHVMVNDYLL